MHFYVHSPVFTDWNVRQRDGGSGWCSTLPVCQGVRSALFLLFVEMAETILPDSATALVIGKHSTSGV